MDKSDFKVGQTVYLRIIEHSNAARYILNSSNPENWIKEKVVIKIGRKYITVSDSTESADWDEIKFDITNEFKQYSEIGRPNYELYLFKEYILEDFECDKMCNRLRKEFTRYDYNKKYSFKQLKQVYEILGLK